ncbi:P63C domain-containing protein [Francisella tularensis]|uniref:P63C domain-containing protein n=1 Tax=Francisella tularensis TaxID=263 RepID=UPI0008F48EB8|nr:P63C domain-containing protein [Francisella tularensis]APA83276.1 hypothetical protein N894_1292 [Francisella tularensis subsp. novicida PA10-7858]
MKKVSHEGVLDLQGFEIPCYVLEDGTRVLSGRGMQNALKMVDDTNKFKQSAGTRLIRYLNQKSLEPFIYKENHQDHFEPIKCKNGNQIIHGYEATVLVDICDAFLEARKHIELSSRQSIIADQCEILIRSFAKVGITALVDEATGYQYDREKDELQKILKAYIAEELLPWSKKFPDIFYQEIFRLNNWDFTVKGINKRPSVIGRWTSELIYEQLPDGVLQHLKENVPKSSRLHQGLTDEIGQPHLSKQLSKVVALMQISESMDEFKSNFDKMVARESGQLSMNI